MSIAALMSSAAEILPLRERYRDEMNCQVIHDSIHRRPGWTKSWLLTLDGVAAGFGSLAIAGPWKERPTIFEFHVAAEHRRRVFDFFAALLTASGARFIETQTNGTLLAHMLHIWSHDVTSEKILFRDQFTTALPSQGAGLQRVTTAAQDRQCIAQRSGSSDWRLELDGKPIGQGGIAFHYNVPYGDVFMEIAEPFRRRGFGALLVQELKRVCYELGAIPGARCSPDNVASRETLQKAGFVPCGHLLVGSISPA